MDGQQQPPAPPQPIQISLTSGRGLLDSKALWACVVGPHRLAMAQGRSVQMSRTEAVLLVKNMGAADAYVFAGVAVPFDENLGALNVMMSRESELGANTKAPYVITPQRGGGGFGPAGFMQMLAPGEQLYGQITDPAVDERRVVVATVQF